MSSAKPMSSISSASSSTTVRMPSTSSEPRPRWSRTPSRRADDDVDAAFERLQLAEDRLAAVDRDDLDAELAAVLEDRLGHLHRQLACRHEDEGRGGRGGRGRGRASAAPAGRTRRSCRCRSPPGRRGRALRAGAGSSRAGPASAPRSRARSASSSSSGRSPRAAKPSSADAVVSHRCCLSRRRRRAARRRSDMRRGACRRR